ncbi:MAG: hypothetical protein LBO77_04075, partial [Desulfovibrio sp.]|nr:hypothetical protein [Desulfovibrio sp.]
MSPEMSRIAHVSRPAAGNAQIVSFPAGLTGQVLALDFDLQGVSVNRSANDLVFTFDDGGALTLMSFFKVEGDTLPPFQLRDGTQVDGKELLSSLNGALDVTPAAGPSPGGSLGGLGSYSDDAGSLLDGVDRMGAGDDALGQWGYGSGGGALAGAGGGAAVDLNDQPVVFNAEATAVEDELHPGGSLAAYVLDPDAGDVHIFQALPELIYTDAQGGRHTVSAEEAGFSLAPDGTWTLDTTRDLYQDLSAGANGRLEIFYTATDNSGEGNATSAPATLAIT